MRKITLRQRLGYLFDAFMSRGTSAMLVGLAAFSTVVVVAAALVIRLTAIAPEGEGLGALLWMGLMHTLEPGVSGDSGSPFFILVLLMVSIAGMFVFGALIGILNTGLEGRLEALRKGRSLVLEKDHTLILGWNPQVFTIVAEMVEANASRKSGAAVVVLANADKVEMEDAIRERVPDTRNTRVVCRSGSPADPTDLTIASPDTARSIIILPQGTDPDTHVIKSVLAITNNPARCEEPYRIVTQVTSPANRDVVRMVGARDVVVPVLANDLIARVAAQTSRQSGLSVVYTELMDFTGDEMYFSVQPALVGRTYGEALSAFESCSVVGIRRSDGTVALNPPMDTRIATGEALVAIAADEDRIAPSSGAAPAPAEDAIRTGLATPERLPEKALVLGWNDSGPVIVHELDSYVAPGSTVTVVSDRDSVETSILASGPLVNQGLRVTSGDIRDRSLLESLGAADFDHVIVLAYTDLGAEEADAITLVTLLHLRDIAERDETPFSIVSEMLDLRNRDLAKATRADDFIVSAHLLSLLMAQLSDNVELGNVFDDILEAEGAEISLKAACDYVVCGQPVDFHTVLEAAKRRGETAIGYRLMRDARDAGASYGVRINPRKSDRVTLEPDDRIIVFAEN